MPKGIGYGRTVKKRPTASTTRRKPTLSSKPRRSLTGTKLTGPGGRPVRPNDSATTRRKPSLTGASKPRRKPTLTSGRRKPSLTSGRRSVKPRRSFR